MDAMTTIESETGDGGVEATLPTEAVMRGLWDALDATDDEEYLAALALKEGLLMGLGIDEVVREFYAETGRGLPEQVLEVA